MSKFIVKLRLFDFKKNEKSHISCDRGSIFFFLLSHFLKTTLNFVYIFEANYQVHLNIKVIRRGKNEEIFVDGFLSFGNNNIAFK